MELEQGVSGGVKGPQRFNLHLPKVPDYPTAQPPPPLPNPQPSRYFQQLYGSWWGDQLKVSKEGVTDVWRTIDMQKEIATRTIKTVNYQNQRGLFSASVKCSFWVFFLSSALNAQYFIIYSCMNKLWFDSLVSLTGNDLIIEMYLLTKEYSCSLSS